jgi:GTPase
MRIFYQTFGRVKKKFSSFLSRFFKKKRTRIGIYGPPNAGKTTLANRIARDWTGDAVGPVSEIPHETRRARRKDDIIISGANGATLTIDIVDTPGVTTRIDYHEFLEFGLDKDEAVIRAREATEGVAEAMHWLREDIDGVIYMLDSTLDPFMQVNIMMVGIIESRKLPVLIVANKIDLPQAAPARIRSAFPQHPVIPVSGLDGKNVEELYEMMIERFG